MAGFVKLYGEKLLDSSVWIGSPKNVKILWIALLSLADQEGQVLKSLPGLAHRADLTLDETIHAIEILKLPDPHSQTKLYEGRRLEEIDGGWLLLNYRKHRDFQTEEQLKWAERKRKWRERKEAGHVPGVPETSGDKTTDADADANANADATQQTSSTSLVRADSFTWIQHALRNIADRDFEDHRLLWEGRTVFSFWVWRRNKFLQRDPSEAELAKVIFTKDRKARVNKWLIVYGLEDCLLAVIGLFHHRDMQQQDGTSYTEFENVFRPQGGGTLEKLRDEGIRHRKPVDTLINQLKEQGWHE